MNADPHLAAVKNEQLRRTLGALEKNTFRSRGQRPTGHYRVGDNWIYFEPSRTA